ncbi:MAG: peptidylprolyl isomerase [Alphaproteobacteria bacterium]|nr:MAG: peptidylprolyl isomerase [Alphaproteobacteria bacterium]
MPRLPSLFLALAGLFWSALAAAQNAPQTVPTEAQVPPPPPPLEAENSWVLDLSTGGRVVIQLRPDVAPHHVERIKTLTRQGFYNGLTFFRVIEGFMAQGGDPENSGVGGSPLPNLEAEINGLPHTRGAIGMARAQELNSANSQFYIMFMPRLQMDRQYTVLGRVVSGMNFVDAIERGEPPAAPSRIVRASIGSDNVPPMTAEQLRAEAERMAAAAPRVAAASQTAGPAEPPPAAGPHPLEPVRSPNAPPRPRRPQR